MLENEDLKWKQRARVHWLQNVDWNTKFFHTHANEGRKINFIGEVTNAEGMKCSRLNQINKALLDYYQSLFLTSGPTGGDECLTEMEEKVTWEMNDQLALDFTEEELCKVISQMAPYRSPGPDGYPPCFHQKFWPMIGKEVCKAVLFCLNSGRSLANINDTNIVLIHKKKVSDRLRIFSQLAYTMWFIKWWRKC